MRSLKASHVGLSTNHLLFLVDDLSQTTPIFHHAEACSHRRPGCGPVLGAGPPHHGGRRRLLTRGFAGHNQKHLGHGGNGRGPYHGPPIVGFCGKLRLPAALRSIRVWLGLGVRSLGWVYYLGDGAQCGALLQECETPTYAHAADRPARLRNTNMLTSQLPPVTRPTACRPGL